MSGFSSDTTNPVLLRHAGLPKRHNAGNSFRSSPAPSGRTSFFRARFWLRLRSAPLSSAPSAPAEGRIPLSSKQFRSRISFFCGSTPFCLTCHRRWRRRFFSSCLSWLLQFCWRFRSLPPRAKRAGIGDRSLCFWFQPSPFPGASSRNWEPQPRGARI